MKTYPDPESIDDENPEWTEENFARARPASEMLPKIFGAEIAAKMLQPKSNKQVKLRTSGLPVALEH